MLLIVINCCYWQLYFGHVKKVLVFRKDMPHPEDGTLPYALIFQTSTDPTTELCLLQITPRDFSQPSSESS